MESKEELQAEEVEDEGPPPGYQTILPPPQPQPPSPPPPPQPSSSSPPKEAAEPVVTPSTDSTPIHTLTPKSTLPAQIICGSCHRLLKYPPGAKQVQCSCCQTFNFVLEAHQVGQVKCGSCTALMYPCGASQVRCSCCQFVQKLAHRTSVLHGRHSRAHHFQASNLFRRLLYFLQTDRGMDVNVAKFNLHGFCFFHKAANCNLCKL